MVSISIGIPVRNGERYIEEAIESIINQTVKDIEIIISDNASFDKTREICEKYSKIDKRIKYISCRKNIGAAANFNKVFNISNGKYFKWAAHDDIIEPDFLSKCYDILEKDESIVLCFSRVKIINDQGNEIEEYPNLFSNLKSPIMIKRFEELVKIQHRCYEIFGLIRSKELRKTNLIGNYIASDRNLIAELGLLGRFEILPEFLFHSREHDEKSGNIKMHERTGWFDPRLTNKTVFPFWKTFYEYSRSVYNHNCRLGEKIRCQLVIISWAVSIWRNFPGDVKLVINNKIKRSFSSLKRMREKLKKIGKNKLLKNL